LYKKVKTKEELEIFDSIWIPAWKEKGFDLECLLGHVDRYLIHNSDNEYIGSVSFRPYNFDSTIDDVYPFHQNNIVKQNIGHIIEIDNLAILKEYREVKNLAKVVVTLVEYAKVHEFNYYIATADYAFYKAVHKFYPTSLYPLHKRINYRGNNLVPIIIDIQHTIANIDKYKWLHDFYLLENSSMNR
jgi:hypothetical protein